MESSVTFDHKTHTMDYELECMECHRGAGCAPCHSAKSPEEELVSFTSGCLACHEKTGCMECHDSKSGEKCFDHSLTEFPLKTYHQELDCRSCHTSEDRHDTAPVSCGMCHKKGWDPKTFNHEVTGLKLDSIHGDESCDKCHPDFNFRKSTHCIICHDEDFQYPDALPGDQVKPDPHKHHKQDQAHAGS